MILNKKKPRFSVVSVDVLQHMVCCNTWLQHMVKCVAVYILCCSALSVAMCCNVRFLSVAMCCNVLQCVAVDIFKSLDCQYADFPVNRELRFVAVCCSVLQCVAVCCSVLQCVACVATKCTPVLTLEN